MNFEKAKCLEVENKTMKLERTEILNHGRREGLITHGRPLIVRIKFFICTLKSLICLKSDDKSSIIGTETGREIFYTTRMESRAMISSVNVTGQWSCT